MNQHKRTEAVNRLTEEIKATTDPELLVKLSNSLAKLVKQGRRRKAISKPVEKAPKKDYSRILDAVTGSHLDTLSDGEKVLHYLVEQHEKRRRTGQNINTPEIHVFHAELMASLSDRERAALEAYQASQRVEGA